MTRAVFLGTPPAAVPALAALASRATVVAVVTRPDKPRGRSGRPAPPPVKEAARAWGLPVHQPAGMEDLRPLLEDCDVAVVVAYGRILPAGLLDLPAHGFVNLHFSLLPRWRGAAPVARAILAGDATTGVTLMRVDEGLDTGPIGAVRAVEIDPADTTGTLTARLAAEGADLLRTAFSDVVTGRVDFNPQPADGVTAAPPVTVGEARLDPARGRSAAAAAVRAFNPAPGAWGMVAGQRLKVWQAAAAGPVLEAGALRSSSGGVLLGTGDGSLELVEVQPAGRVRMPAAAWWRGLPPEPRRFE